MTASLAVRLREAVLPAHRRIEGLPFFVALAGRALPVERYVDQLRVIAIAATALERAVSQAQDPAVQEARAAAAARSGRPASSRVLIGSTCTSRTPCASWKSFV